MDNCHKADCGCFDDRGILKFSPERWQGVFSWYWHCMVISSPITILRWPDNQDILTSDSLPLTQSRATIVGTVTDVTRAADNSEAQMYFGNKDVSCHLLVPDNILL